jgi:hypothetical protein
VVQVKECPGSEQVTHCSLGGSLRAVSCGSLAEASTITPSALKEPADPAGSKRKRVTSSAKVHRVVPHPTVRAIPVPPPIAFSASDALPSLPLADSVSEA